MKHPCLIFLYQFIIHPIKRNILFLTKLSETPQYIIICLCRSIASKVRKWVGIPVSIGVAPTKTLAKIASHFAKTYKGYGGVCMINTEQKRIKALELTPIEEVWGVGRKLAPKMAGWGISTAMDFAARPREWVDRKLGLHGVRTWEELGGRVCIEAEKEDRRKSICTSRSFADMTGELQDLSQRVSDFAARCARKLREEGSAAGVGTAGRVCTCAVPPSPRAARGRSIRARLRTSPTRKGARSARHTSAFRKLNTSMIQNSGEWTGKVLKFQEYPLENCIDLAAKLRYNILSQEINHMDTSKEAGYLGYKYLSDLSGSAEDCHGTAQSIGELYQRYMRGV